MTGRSRLMAAALLAVTFAVGGMAGMVAEESLGLDWFDFLDSDLDSRPEVLAGLDLTSEQRERAEEILEREEDRLEDYWESRIPEIQQEVGQTYAEIRAILTPEQQSIFDRRVRELGARLPAEMSD